jgi:hypothetical protein
MSMEAVVVLPTILTVFFALFAFFNIYNAKSLSQKASYTISDLLTRETRPVNGDYLEGLHKVYDHLIRSSSPTGLRVSVVRCKSTCNLSERQLEVVWSHATRQGEPLRNSDLPELDSRIPDASLGDQLILVETRHGYIPWVGAGFTNLSSFVMAEFVFSRPRYAPRLCWIEC